ncbi:MAG: hypothetical protein KGI06_01460 [Candidatus Micrarchaeota archaeon]|nr:hypothetical protein [Candidatus Micrarchaeota archaeon]
MAKKLPLSPDISYFLGAYRCNRIYRNIYLHAADKKLVERFVKIAIMELGTKADAVSVTIDGKFANAEIGNSKLKKLLDKALEERDRIFKYRNEYSASYFAAMFDCNGAMDRKGMFVRGMDSYDRIILERIGFHTKGGSGKCYFRNGNDFFMFIAPFSIKAQLINRYVEERSTG